jgi:hypothetical protein
MAKLQPQMNARLAYVLALCVAATAASLPLPGPAAPPPAPAPTLAPIEDPESPNPAPSSSAAPKLLGHVFVSAFCTTFVERFNVAARTMVADDVRLDDAVAAVRAYEDDFSRLDGAFSAWDHRLQLIAALKDLLVTIPKTQAAVNDLREQAKEATDPQRRDALAESAARLQESVDHQRIVAREMQALVGLMLDMHSAEDTVGHTASGMLAPGEKFNANALDAPVPKPGDVLVGRTHSGVPRGPSAIELVLRVPRDRLVIGDAEAGAAAAAARVVRTCIEESK